MYFICYHECGIESQSEMTDDLISIGIIFIFFNKICGTRKSYLCNVFFYFFRCHTKAIIDELHGLILCADDHFHFSLVIIRHSVITDQCQLLQFRNGITSVRYQLTHENIMIGIKPLFNNRKNILTVNRKTSCFVHSNHLS